MRNYHVRVHYRTPSKASGRRVTWFPEIKAKNMTEAKRVAIERVTSRKTNSGQVEVLVIDVRRKEQANA